MEELDKVNDETDFTTLLKDLNENFFDKFIKNGNTIFEGKEQINNFFEEAFAEDNVFNNFLKSKGQNTFNVGDSCFPELYELLLNEKKREDIDKNYLDDKVIQLPSKVMISRREMFLLKESIAEKFKLLTDVNCSFLDAVFEYLFGDYYDKKTRELVNFRKRKIYYCPCSGEFLSTENKLLDIGGTCKKCKEKIKGENRIENISMLNQIENLFNRDDIVKSIEEYNNFITTELKEQFNGLNY